MKKVFLILGIILTSIMANGQNVDIVSKYSYYIHGKTGESRIVNGHPEYAELTATCFFIRKNNILYIVGAAHTFTGARHQAELPIIYHPDILYVRLYNTVKRKNEDFPIDIRDIKKHTPTNYFENNPDIFIKEINIPKNLSVNTIENFINENTKGDVNTTKCVSYGYPQGYAQGVKKMSEFSIATYTPANNPENGKFGIFTLTLTNGIFTHGCSGAPLFFVNIDNSIYFAGVGNGLAKDGKVIFDTPLTLQNMLSKLK
jgi:hypothetical protein